MSILIFGGTTEGRELAEFCSENNIDCTVSVATELGREQLEGIGCRILCGRMDLFQIENIISEYDMIIDATHPYAVEVSSNLKSACHGKVKFLRLTREFSADVPCKSFDSCFESAEYLKAADGRILLTTGSKELASFSGINPDRLYPRILPVHESLEACERLSIPHRNIIAMQGPFSKELNLAIIRQYDIKYIVTKDGGAAGGFDAKIKAAEESGTEIILIRRPEEKGMTIENIKAEVMKLEH